MRVLRVHLRTGMAGKLPPDFLRYARIRHYDTSATTQKRNERVRGIEPPFRYPPSDDSLGRMRVDLKKRPCTLPDVMTIL
jgi:hypothetical protein